MSRWASWTFCGLVVILLLGWLTRNLWLMPWLERTAETTLGEQLGGTYRIGRISGTVFSDLIIDDLELVEADSESGIRRLDLNRVRVAYRPWAFLTGSPLDAVDRIDMQGLKADIDIDRLPAGDTTSGSSDESSGDLGSLLPEGSGPMVHGDADLSVRWSDHQFQIQGLRLGGTLNDLDLDMAAMQVDDHELGAGHFTVRQPSAETTVIRGSMPLIHSLLARIDHSAQVPAIDAEIDLVAGSITVDADDQGMDAVMVDLDLEQVPAWLRHLVEEDNMHMPERGLVDAHVTVRDQRTQMKFDIRALSVDGVPLDRLRGNGALIREGDSETWVIDEIFLLQGIGTLQILNARIDPHTGLQSLTLAEIRHLHPLTLPWIHRRAPAHLDDLTLNGTMRLEQDRLQTDLEATRAGMSVGLSGTMEPSLLSLDASDAGFDLSTSLHLDTGSYSLAPGWRLLGADADLRLAGSLRNPRLDGEIAGSVDSSQGLWAIDRALFSSSDDGITLVDLQISTPWDHFGLVEQTTWHLPLSDWRLDPLRLRGRDGHYRLRAAGGAEGLREASLEIDDRLQSLRPLLPREWRGMLGDVQLQATYGTDSSSAHLAINGLALEDAEDYLAPIDLDLDASVDQEGYHLDLQASGSGSLAISGSLAADGYFGSIDTDSAIAAQVDLQGFPLGWVAQLSDPINRCSGTARADLQISGSLADPQLSGTFRLQDGRLSTLLGLPAITGMQAELVFENGRAVIEQLQARLGSQMATISGSMPFMPDGGDWDVRVSGRDLLVFADPDTRVRADTELHLHGPYEAPVLAGEVGITTLMLDLYINWLAGGGAGGVDPLIQLFSVGAEPFNRIRLDVRVHDGSLEKGGRSDLIISGNTFRGRIHLDLHLQGDLEVPEPAGTLSSSGGQVSLPFTSYRLVRASITFVEENPFDPSIDALARTRMRGYEINVSITGRVLDPRVEVTTTPPLSNERALLLASTGLLPAELGNTSSAIGAALPFIGRQIQDALFGRKDVDSGQSFFDRFSFSFDEERSESGLSTARAEYRLFPKWYLFAERDRWEQHNGGVLLRVNLDADYQDDWLPNVDLDVPEDSTTWNIRAAENARPLPVNERTLLRIITQPRRDYAITQEPLGIIDDAAALLREHLRGLGYLDPTITVETDKADDAGFFRAITLVVATGPLYRLTGVGLLDAPSPLEETLLNLVQDRLPDDGSAALKPLRAASSVMQQKLVLDGYADASVTGPRIDRRDDSATASATYQIDAGQRWVIAETRLDLPSETPANAKLLKRLRRTAVTNREPWTKRSAVDLRAVLLGKVQDQGYHKATVEVTSVRGEEPGNMILLVDVDLGPRLYMGSLELQGLERTSRMYLRGRLGLKEGELLNEENYEQALVSLRSTYLFQRIDSTLTIIEDTASADTGASDTGSAATDTDGALAAEDTASTHVTITLEEAPAREVEVHAGIGSYEGLRGGALYRDRNLFGMGRTWEVEGLVSQKHLGASTRIIDRDVLGINNRLIAEVSYMERERPSFILEKLGFELRGIIQLSSDARVEPFYQLEEEQTRDAPDEDQVAENERIRNALLGYDFHWDDRDDPFLPEEGARLSLELAKADEAIGSELDYYHLGLQIGYVLPISDDRSRLFATISGQTRPLGDDHPDRFGNDLPITERLFLGGANSVRSFATDQLGPPDENGDSRGGRTIAFAQLEWRYRVAGDFHIAGFYDIGTIGRQAFELQDEYGEAIGLGLRYYLPVGPLRLDFGWNPDGEEFAADDPYAVHFAVGFTF